VSLVSSAKERRPVVVPRTTWEATVAITVHKAVHAWNAALDWEGTPAPTVAALESTMAFVTGAGWPVGEVEVSEHAEEACTRLCATAWRLEL
jgi:hypothetical protein